MFIASGNHKPQFLVPTLWRPPALRRSAAELRLSSGGRSRRFLVYFLYVLIVTGALAASAVLKDVFGDASDLYRPGFGDRTCWFSRGKALMMFFAAPLVVLMVANVALFCGSAVIIRRTAQTSVTTCSSKVRFYGFHSTEESTCLS